MSRHLIGQPVTLFWYTQDVDGNDQNCDAPPTVTCPDATVTTTNPSVGAYVSTFTPTTRGRHVIELDGVLDTLPEYGVQYVTVHDGAAEAAGGPFPNGVQSWESAVR